MILINLLLSSQFYNSRTIRIMNWIFRLSNKQSQFFFFFKWYFFPLTDKIIEIISPYLFLKYWPYNNTFTYLFFPLIFSFF